MLKQTLAARSHARKLAKKAQKENPYGVEGSTAYEFQMIALREHRRILSDIKSIESRIEYKKRVMPEFWDYVEIAISENTGKADAVVSNVMVWLFDIGEIAKALQVAEYMLAHDMPAPDTFSRSTAAVTAEETAVYYLQHGLTLQWEKGEIKNEFEGVQAAKENLLKAAALTEKTDMHDQVRAKLFKAVGYSFAVSGDYVMSLEALNRALKLFAGAGVKKDIERIQRLANKPAE